MRTHWNYFGETGDEEAPVVFGTSITLNLLRWGLGVQIEWEPKVSIFGHGLWIYLDLGPLAATFWMELQRG